MASFYDDFLKPFYQTTDSNVRDFTGGMQDYVINPYILDPMQSGLNAIESHYAQPTVQPGPSFYNLGTGRRPTPAAANPPDVSPPNASGVPFYLAKPETASAPVQAPPQTPVSMPQAPAEQDSAWQGIEDLGQPPTPGEPGVNEYESIVKEYLNRLRQPSEMPKPPELTQMQRMAIALNPGRAGELTELYQGNDYKARLLQYQQDQQRQGQAAQVASGMLERQQDLERRDAERAWFRESAMANAGAALPPGYKWKNPELGAIWQQKVHEKQQQDKRTQKYLDSVTRGNRPATKEEYLKQLFGEEARLQGQLLNPATQQAQIMANAGAGDERTMRIINDIGSQLDYVGRKKQVIQSMGDEDFQQFIKLDGVQQEQIISEYLDALKGRNPAPPTASAP